jgi:hypothetical protein
MKLLNHCLAVGALPIFIIAGCGSSTPPTAGSGANTEGTIATSTTETDAGSNVEEQPASPDTANTSTVSPAPVDLMAAEMAAYERAKPIFEDQCAGCHTPEPSRKKPKKGISHFSMAGYPFDGHHKHELGQAIRVAIGATDKPATMPQDDPGSIEGADREVILAWADAFDAAASAKVGYHAISQEGGHEHSKKGHEHKKEHKHPKKTHEHKKKQPKKKKAHEHKHDHSHKH